LTCVDVASIGKTMSRKSEKSVFFVYAPPLLGVRKSRRKAPQPADQKSERWKWSVFYYWWEYLRRHEGYLQTCEAGGIGQFAKLYADFGDVHSCDFWSWWKSHSHLFSEPEARKAEPFDPSDMQEDDQSEFIYIRIPRENPLKLTLRQVTRIVKPKLVKRDNRKIVTQARYKVATKPLLPSLDMHLKVWDARRDNPSATLAELADISGVSINHDVNGETLANRAALRLSDDKIRKVLKRRKELVVQRHLRIAEQYIQNVAEQETFPLRTSR
jgi:hypothetical protein